MLLPTAALLVGIIVILFAAELFTNGVEWLGRKLKLGEGAVGSILAAVGTALPETLLPIVAIVGGTIAGDAPRLAADRGRAGADHRRRPGLRAEHVGGCHRLGRAGAGAVADPGAACHRAA